MVHWASTREEDMLLDFYASSTSSRVLLAKRHYIASSSVCKFHFQFKTGKLKQSRRSMFNKTALSWEVQNRLNMSWFIPTVDSLTQFCSAWIQEKLQLSKLNKIKSDKLLKTATAMIIFILKPGVMVSDCICSLTDTHKNERYMLFRKKKKCCKSSQLIWWNQFIIWIWG